MAKTINCRDVGSDCDFTICAQTEEEFFSKATEHARSSHNLSEIPSELFDKLRSGMRDVDHC